MLAKEEFSRVLDDRLDQVARPVHGGRPPPAEHPRFLEDIFEGCDDEGILGREMMQLGASGEASFLRHLRGPKTGVAAFADEVSRSFEDAGAGFLAAFGLGAAARRPDRSSRGGCRRCYSVGAGWHVRPLCRLVRRSP